MVARHRARGARRPDPIAYIRRQEQAICSRLGAGSSLDEAYRHQRWINEAARDFQVDMGVARLLVDRIFAELVDATSGMDDPRSRVAAARMVYAHYLEMSRDRGDDLGGDGGDNGHHMVYQLYSKDGGLLYVGITRRGPARLVDHYKSKPWFNDVTSVEFERYETEYDSRQRERFLIERRSPLYNVQHNMGRHIA